MFSMRFDMRVPGFTPEQITTQYQCALEMAAYADSHAQARIGLVEHHASDDGYLSSPLVLASAMAAVTERTPIMIAATLLPLYEPVRLAEDIVQLDYISAGRVSYVMGIGYRPVEYDLFGLDYERRGAIVEEKINQLLAVLSHASDASQEKRITPALRSPIKQIISYGGGSKPAARRAGRLGLNFFAQANFPGLREAYEAGAREADQEPGICALPELDRPNIVFVHDDLDAAWDELGPFLLHDAMSYASWNENAGRPTISLSREQTVEGMREEEGAYRVVTCEGARDLIAKWGPLPLSPLCGGLPPDRAWPYLRRVVEEVMPSLTPA